MDFRVLSANADCRAQMVKNRLFVATLIACTAEPGPRPFVLDIMLALAQGGSDTTFADSLSPGTNIFLRKKV